MRVGAAAAPRWWGVDSSRFERYLDHLVTYGATSVEMVVHDGPFSRDPWTVHVDRSQWGTAVTQAVVRGLRIAIHNSLDPRLGLDRFETDRTGFAVDIGSTLDLLADIEQRQGSPPIFVVHAGSASLESERVTGEAIGWIGSELSRRGGNSVTAVELRAAADESDRRFDRDRDALGAFVASLTDARVGLCWDFANDWLSSRRRGIAYAIPISLPGGLAHVHLHDISGTGILHAPLGDGGVPWRAALELLASGGWAGSATLEIRYRLASDVGDPWTVLAESFRRAVSVEK